MLARLLTPILPYAMAALVAVVAALVGAMLWYRADAANAEAEKVAAEARLATALAVNQENQATIAWLRAATARNEKILSDMSDEILKINETYAERREAVSELERTNETVRDYLDEPVPDDLRRVYAR